MIYTILTIAIGIFLVLDFFAFMVAGIGADKLGKDINIPEYLVLFLIGPYVLIKAIINTYKGENEKRDGE